MLAGFAMLCHKIFLRLPCQPVMIAAEIVSIVLSST